VLTACDLLIDHLMFVICFVPSPQCSLPVIFLIDHLMCFCCFVPSTHCSLPAVKVLVSVWRFLSCKPCYRAMCARCVLFAFAHLYVKVWVCVEVWVWLWVCMCVRVCVCAMSVLDSYQWCCFFDRRTIWVSAWLLFSYMKLHAYMHMRMHTHAHVCCRPAADF
jgi:hypothetical protein